METNSRKKWGRGKRLIMTLIDQLTSEITTYILQKKRTSARFAALSSREAFEFLS